MAPEFDTNKPPDMVRSLQHETLNSLQPVFKLPAELLTRIVNDALPSPLDQLADNPHNQPAWRTTARAVNALLSISQTCRWLRKVVLADPILWRHITGDRHFDQLLLSRSGPTSPLTMVLASTVRNLPLYTTSTEFDRQLVPRLQELHILGCVHSITGLTPFLESQFPNLESFSPAGSDGMVSRENRSHDLLPLYGINAPRLRYLSLGLTRLLPAESGFPHLTHLSLSCIVASNLHSRVSNFLKNCPALTSLVLRRLQCLTRIHTTKFWSPIPTPIPLPLHSSKLYRVILADMDPNVVEYYGTLFSEIRPCLQIPIFQREPFWAREREVFGALYHQYERGTEDVDVSRLSVGAHAVDHHIFGAASGFSVTLAGSTNLLRVTVWPKLPVLDPYGRRDWRADVLAPLRGLSSVREIWLTDADMIMDQRKLSGASAGPLWSPSDPGSISRGRGPHADRKPTCALPSLSSAVVVHDCSSRLRLHDSAIQIQPGIGVLPKRRRGDGESTRALEHLRIAIGYEADGLPRLRRVWGPEEPAAPGEPICTLQPQGKVDLSARLLRELASAEYAYVKRARLVVQLMPHLVLDADELERLRGHFVKGVVVEEIDRLPQMPVTDRVRDDMFSPERFIPGSVLF